MALQCYDKACLIYTSWLCTTMRLLDRKRDRVLFDTLIIYRSKGDEEKGQVSTKQTADDDEPPASAKEAANDELSVSSGEPSDTNVALESPGEVSYTHCMLIKQCM